MTLLPFPIQVWNHQAHVVESFVVVQSLSRVQLFATPWTAAHKASLTFTVSRSLLKLISTEAMMPSNHLILCHPLLLLLSVFPSIRVLVFCFVLSFILFVFVSGNVPNSGGRWPGKHRYLVWLAKSTVMPFSLFWGLTLRIYRLRGCCYCYCFITWFLNSRHHFLSSACTPATAILGFPCSYTVWEDRSFHYFDHVAHNNSALI